MSATYPTTCPNATCQADLTAPDAVRTDECLVASCNDCRIDAETGELEFGGSTDVCWDAQETEAVYCAACFHRLGGGLTRDEQRTALIAAAREALGVLDLIAVDSDEETRECYSARLALVRALRIAGIDIEAELGA